MKKNIIILSICILTTCLCHAYTERNLLTKSITKEALKKTLSENQSWVPYPHYKDRKGWDNLMKENKQHYIQSAEKCLTYKWKIVTAEDYLAYEQNGDRMIMEKPFDKNNQVIVQLMMGELAEGKGRFIPQLINGVFHACEMTSWSESAHLSALQKTHRSLPDYNDTIIDLGSGNLSAAMSWVYYFFHNEFDKIDPAISKRIYHEVKRRTMDTYMNQNRFWWMALQNNTPTFVNNWNPWCNSNVLECFMLLENDKNKLADAIYRTMTSVDKYINYVHADGACEEGPTYWGVSGGKLYDYLKLLTYITNNKINLFKEPFIKNIGEFICRSYVGNNWVVNFADASAKGGSEISLIYRFGKDINSSAMTNFAAHLDKKYSTKHQQQTGVTDVFRALESMKYIDEIKQHTTTFTTPNNTWYSDTQFCFMKNKNGLFLAAKGGNNNESHNHNDVGTFNLYSDKTPIFIDAGVGTYTKKTFSSQRYDIWTMQSNYHNVPLINGSAQKDGEKYKALNVHFNAAKQTFSVNIAKAYPDKAQIEKWIRNYHLEKNKVIINDSFRLKEAQTANKINFMVWGNINITNPGKIEIDVQNKKMILNYNSKAFTPSTKTITLTDKRLSNVWGKQIYRITLTAKHLSKTGNYTYTIIKK